MRRREFIEGLGSTATAWPLAARAQQPAMPVMGYLAYGRIPSSPGVPFLQGLAQAGYVPGRNLAIEFRGANFQGTILPRLAADLVARGVALIVTRGSPSAAVAAKAATSTTPIVFILAEDPIEYGLVASFNRPGGNITGVTLLSAELAAKRLNLLIEFPQVTMVGYLCPSSDTPIVRARISEMLAAGRALGREIIVLEVRRLDFEAAFATLVERRVGALIVGNYALFSGDPSNRDRILELAARHKVPAIYTDRKTRLRVFGTVLRATVHGPVLFPQGKLAGRLLFGIDWLRNGIPIAKETSVLEDEAEAVADAKRRAAHVVQQHPGSEPDSFRVTDPTSTIRGVFSFRAAAGQQPRPLPRARRHPSIGRVDA
jgi:putative tryptophan/tyrosine transport system substrate-binding protein